MGVDTWRERKIRFGNSKAKVIELIEKNQDLGIVKPKKIWEQN